MAALKPIREEKNLLKQDVKSMKEGTLGLSEAEKSQLTGKALRGAERASQHAVREAQRQAMATQGPAGPFMGQAAAHTQDLVKQAQEQAAAASSEAESVSRDLAERRAAQTRARLEARAQRRREQPGKALNVGLQLGQFAMTLGTTPVVKNALGTIKDLLGRKAGSGGTSGKSLVDSAAGAATGAGPVGAAVDKKQAAATQEKPIDKLDTKYFDYFMSAEPEQKVAMAKALGMSVDDVTQYINQRKAIAGQAQGLVQGAADIAGGAFSGIKSNLGS